MSYSADKNIVNNNSVLNHKHYDNSFTRNYLMFAGLFAMAGAAIASNFFYESIGQKQDKIDNNNQQDVTSAEKITIADILNSKLSEEQARKILPFILDAAGVPHGDMSIYSEKPHSKRYIISQWQRVSAGACVVVLGEDQAGELYVALGVQKNKKLKRDMMRIPQGYMEAPLPKEDLTGFKKQGASRWDSTDNKLVASDANLRDTAVREIAEEIGLKINKGDLSLLSVESHDGPNDVVHTIAASYGVIIKAKSKLPNLQMLDTEFGDNDLRKPNWYKITDIKQRNDGNFYAGNSQVPIEDRTVAAVTTAIKALASKEQQNNCREFLASQVKDHAKLAYGLTEATSKKSRFADYAIMPNNSIAVGA